jgi:hypothetical protein
MAHIDNVIAKLCESDEETLKQSMNTVADLYREGADLRTLIPLLRHSDSRVVQCGVWIASEVVDKEHGRELFSELSELLEHPDSAVRFWTIASVAFLVNPQDYSVVHRLFLRVLDVNPGVRQQALWYLCLLPDEVVASLTSTNTCRSARLLLRGATKDELRLAVKSKEMFEQMMAVAGAMRNFGKDEDFVKELLPHLPNEALKIVSTLPKDRSVSL